MNDTERSEKGNQLREELRRVRREKSGNSEGLSTNDSGQSGTIGNERSDGRGYDNDSPATSGTSNQVATNTDSGNKQSARRGRPRKGDDADTQRTTDEITQRLRLPDRRSSVDSSSLRTFTTDAYGSDGTSTGRITRTDAIPSRDFEEKEIPEYPGRKQPKLGRPKKDEAVSTQNVVVNKSESTIVKPKQQNIFENFRKKSKGILSATEARDLKQPLSEAIKDYAKYADQYIQYKTHTYEAVWSNLDDEEVEFLVTFLIKRGQTNPVAASTIRNAVASNEYLALFMMIAPRTQTTYKMLDKVRKDKLNADIASGKRAVPVTRRSAIRPKHTTPDQVS